MASENKFTEDDFVFFYGHNPYKHGEYAIFSNWFSMTPFTDQPCGHRTSPGCSVCATVGDEGHKFEYAEMYMMWRKALLFGDNEMAEHILTIKGAKECKMLGRRIQGFNQEIWDKNTKQIMVDGLMLKFRDERLREKLLATKDKIIVEASPYDKIWGIGMSATDPDRLFPNRWKGKNWLGESLMQVRTNYRTYPIQITSHGQ